MSGPDTEARPRSSLYLLLRTWFLDSRKAWAKFITNVLYIAV